MLLNNTTTNRINGVVKEPEAKKDYVGVTTDTSIVEVNPERKEIAVHVRTENLLDWSGDAADKAYTAKLGSSALLRADMALIDVREECARAKSAEKNLEHMIQETHADISVGDGENLIKIQEETERAKLAEERLQQQILGGSTDLDDFSVEVDNKFISVDKKINKTKADLHADIREVKDELFDELYEASKTLNTKIETLETKHDEFEDYASNTYVTNQKFDTLDDSVESVKKRLTTVESDYASKDYVYQSVHSAITLSKQLIDEIDLVNNTVIVNNVSVEPVSGVLYMLKDTTATTSDIYKEYTLIEEKLTLIGDTSVSLDEYAKLSYVDEKMLVIEDYIDEVVESIPEVDLTDYAKKSEIPDVSSFFAEIPEEYITEDELEDKGFYNRSAILELLSNIKFVDGGTSASV